MFGRPLDRERHPGLAGASEAAFEGLVRGVVAAQAEGQIRPGEPRAVARVLWALPHGIAVLAVADQFAVRGRAGVDELTALAARMLVEGLAPRPPA